MTYYRRDDYVQMAILFGAIPNTAVTYYTQPGLALATIYADPNGVTQIANPQFTDGFGHAVAYMAAGTYTVTYSGPQIQTLTLPDQIVGPGGGGSSVTAFAGVPSGTVDGVNRVFTLTNNGVNLTTPPTQATVWKNFPLVPDSGSGTGYTLSGVTVVYDVAPTSSDEIYAEGFTVA